MSSHWLVLSKYMVAMTGKVIEIIFCSPQPSGCTIKLPIMLPLMALSNRTVSCSLPAHRGRSNQSQSKPSRCKKRGSLTCHRDLRAPGCVGSHVLQRNSVVENFFLYPTLRENKQRNMVLLLHVTLTALRLFQIWYCWCNRGIEAELASLIWFQNYNLRGFNQHTCRLEHTQTF